MSTARPFESLKLIRFHHCDPAGIVFYPQYFVLMNELVEDWFNEGLGVDFARFHAEGRHGIPMAHLECDFLAPSTVGETLAFRLSVRRSARARSRSPSRPARARRRGSARRSSSCRPRSTRGGRCRSRRSSARSSRATHVLIDKESTS